MKVHPAVVAWPVPGFMWGREGVYVCACVGEGGGGGEGGAGMREVKGEGRGKWRTYSEL